MSVIIDSGGVSNNAVISHRKQSASGDLPAGTPIAVYTADGHTLLYSYTTTAFNAPSVTSDPDLNTGYTPFQQGPVYVEIGDAGGIGTTNFDYI